MAVAKRHGLCVLGRFEGYEKKGLDKSVLAEVLSGEALELRLLVMVEVRYLAQEVEPGLGIGEVG